GREGRLATAPARLRPPQPAGWPASLPSPCPTDAEPGALPAATAAPASSGGVERPLLPARWEGGHRPVGRWLPRLPVLRDGRMAVLDQREGTRYVTLNPADLTGCHDAQGVGRDQLVLVFEPGRLPSVPVVDVHEVVAHVPAYRRATTPGFQVD